MAPKTVVRYRNRPVKKSRARRKFTVPIAVVAGLLPGLTYMTAGYTGGGFNGMARAASVAWTGFDPVSHTWQFQNMSRGMFPLLIGFVVHKAASLFGINRGLASMGLPIVRI